LCDDDVELGTMAGLWTGNSRLGTVVLLLAACRREIPALWRILGTKTVEGLVATSLVSRWLRKTYPLEFRTLVSATNPLVPFPTVERLTARNIATQTLRIFPWSEVGTQYESAKSCEGFFHCSKLYYHAKVCFGSYGNG
jgi:hypothetical protein